MKRLLLLVVLALGAAAQPATGGRYLVICEDDYVPVVQPLAEWKTRKGVAAVVVPLSVAGTTPSDVRLFIRDAWSNWPQPPEFVLIACSPAVLPGYGYEDDCYYGDMEGDYRMEIPVGRFPATTARECSTMVRRTLNYELSPDTADSSWLTRATTVVCEEMEPDSYYQADSRLARSYWLSHGYTKVESLANLYGHSAWDVLASLNQGRSVITYRGLAGGFWTDPFWHFRPGVGPWANGNRTPLIVSATCATVTVAPGEDMLGNLALRWGTPDSLHGALAFFGTTRLANSCSRYRSACFRGFFDAAYADSVLCLGTATVRARNRVDSLFHEEFYYTEWCLLGDPELGLRTARPTCIEVEHDSVAATGPAPFPVTVTSVGSPLPGAFVCLWMDSTVYLVDTTDAAGRVEPVIAAGHPGSMKVTVTGANLCPYVGSARLSHVAGPWVGYLGHTIVDTFPLGNADAWPGPGETVRMPVRLFNFGDSTAAGVTATISTPDTLVRLLDTLLPIGTVPSHDSASTAPAGFGFSVDSACPDGHQLLMTLTCRDSAGGTWNSDVPLRIGAPLLSFADTTFDDFTGNHNQRLDPRETCAVAVQLHNRGWGEAVDARLRIRSFNSWLEVLDSVSDLGRLAGKSLVDNSSDPFVVRAAHMLPGQVMPCSLELTAIGKRWAWPLDITVGAIDTCDPVPDGPREPPLYWAYDDVDIGYPEAPVYDWLEIRGIGTNLELGDNEVKRLTLPDGFGPFRFYDSSYSILTVSSNGFFVPGSTLSSMPVNQRLPRTYMVQIVAPNWEDLRPDLHGGVWWFHDTAGHRLVIEWDSVAHRVPFDSLTDCFQVVIYDSTRTLPDGNSDFTFQYRTAGILVPLGTTGIQDPGGSVGMTCKHRSIYDRACAAILPGRAIRFTTSGPPIGILSPAGPLRLPPNPNAVRVLPSLTRGTARLELPWTGPVRVSTFDAAGRLLAVCEETAGPNRMVEWRPRDASGRLLPGGAYFIRIRGSAGSATCRVVLAR